MSGKDDRHFQLSSYRETIVEHQLLADLLSFSWSQGRVIEVSRAETDQYGYDMVLTEGRVTRHIQVKASKKGGKARQQTINTALATKPSPCVVWVVVDDTPDGLVLDHFLFFGGAPGSRLPELGTKVGKNPISKNLRPGMRVVPKSSFDRVNTRGELMGRLFGSTAGSVDAS